jgi:hypothetical protein
MKMKMQICFTTKTLKMLVDMYFRTMCDERCSGGDTKAHYTNGEHESDNKSNGKKLLNRVAMKKTCVENAVTVSAGDGPELIYAQ